MDADVLNYGVAYKYCVINNSPNDDMYEKLHGFKTLKDGIRNRYLELSREGMHKIMLWL